MRKIIALALVLMLALPFAAFGEGETFTGEAQGFGGPVSVELTVEDGKITGVVIAGDAETPTVGGAALQTLAEQLTAAGSAEIDGVVGATFTLTRISSGDAIVWLGHDFSAHQ